HQPTRTFRASCEPIAGQVERAFRAVPFANLQTGEEGRRQFVPDFARLFSFPRFPQVDGRVRFYGGAQQELAEYRFAVDQDLKLTVPPGADRVSIFNDDARVLLRGQVLFELAF